MSIGTDFGQICIDMSQFILLVRMMSFSNCRWAEKCTYRPDPAKQRDVNFRRKKRLNTSSIRQAQQVE